MVPRVIEAAMDAFFQDLVPLSGFNNDLLGPLWDDIRNRPLWTDHFGFSQGLLTTGGYILQQIVTKKISFRTQTAYVI